MSMPDNGERLFEIMYTCRSMRRLKPDPVPEELLLQLVDAALQGPSGSNAQNWRFIIVRDFEQKRRVQDLWRRVWAFYQDTFKKAEARPGEDLASRDRMTKAGTYMVEHLHEAPAIVCVGVRRDEVISKVLSSPSTPLAIVKHFGLGGLFRLAAGGSRSATIGDCGTAFPAVQNLLLAARALGLGAVLTTPHLFVPGQFEALLGIPKEFTLAAVIPVGWPKGKFGPVARPGAEEVVCWDRYRD